MTETGKPRLIVIMGVCGSGKSTLAQALALRFGYHFLDADDFHTALNKEQMRSGIPLDDESRSVWVNRLVEILGELADKGTSCVLAYSGIRRRHRQLIMGGAHQTLGVMLAGDRACLEARLLARTPHFMPVTLLDSQLESMEEPEADEKILLLDCARPVSSLIAMIEDTLATLE
jgi:gluconokinase